MQHTSPRNIYYLKNRIFLIILAIGVSILGIWLAIFLKSLAIAILYLLVIVFIYACQTVRIVTSPNGISYYNMGIYAIHSSWENIDRVDLVDFRLLGKQRCIILRNGVKLGPWAGGIVWTVTQAQRGRIIPIPRNNGFGKCDSLMQDLKRYAPHLAGLE
jgi:hypothetical protein